jgi:hypothetical protein
VDHTMTPLLRALTFLHSAQLPHGEFRTLASPDRQMTRDGRFDSSPFVTSLIAHSLGLVGHPLAREMVARAARFLRSEMEGPGLWRYWSSRNPRHRQLELDLDDTCCVAHALRQAGCEVSDNEAVLLANRSPEGLFYTYVVPRTGSPPEVIEALAPLANGATIIKLSAAGMLHEIDPVVQANVLLWLGEREETAPVVAYLIDAVRSGEQAIASRYYPDPLAFYYFLSRAYAAGCRSLGAVREGIVARIEARAAAEYDTALAACTLLNLEQRSEALADAVGELRATQRDDGSWPTSAFYTDGIDCYGSGELTTALCVEAMERCGE